MKNFNELNFYEMLEIPANATDFEIRQAYKDTLSIYDEDSSVTYSLFSDEERKQILESVERAFTTLIDRKKRMVYDQKLLESGQVNESDLLISDRQKLIPIFGSTNSTASVVSGKKIDEKATSKEVQEMATDILSKETISGNDLRAVRRAMGIKLQDVYETTRISVSVLNYLEDDNIEKLPSGSYIKNFVKIYAGFLKLDPGRVVDGYLKNIGADNR